MKADAEGITPGGLPWSTEYQLKDRVLVAGRVQHGCKSGRSPYLTRDEKQELVDYLITCSGIGYPIKRQDEVISGIVRKTRRGDHVE